MASYSAKDQKLLARFGENVSKARATREISQEELAEIAGLHRTYIGSIERGERNISLINLSKIAKALEVSPSTLLE